jgi:hypothetical protein
MLPRVDEEAVEAAKRGQKKCRWQQWKAQLRLSRHCGDKGGSGEEDANGDLFGKAVSAAGGVDEDEVSEEKAAQNEIEVNGFSGESKEKRGKGCRGQQYPHKEGAAMAVVEVVSGFEMLLLPGLAVERASVEEAISSVEHPHGDEHRGDGREGKTDVIGRGDEPDPERSYSRGVKREKMPERQGRAMIFGVGL